MKLLVHKGKTSKIVQIFIQDSTSTTGAGKTGLTSGSSGLICYRARTDDGNAGGTQLSLSAGTKGTWSSGGFVEKDSTNMPGVYELGLDNAGIASGADQVIYMLSGATGMAPLALEVQLTDFDPQDGVHLGLTSLPNVASGSAGAIPTTGTGANQINVDGSGNASANLVNVSGSALSTHAAGMIPADLRDIAGSAVSTTSAQLGVNVVQYNGQTAATDANNLPKVDVEDINGSSTGAVNLGKTTNAIARGTCTTGGSTTSIPTSAFAPGVGASGQFIGRTVLFDANTTTTALQGQATNITASTNSATPTLTVTALTTAPASGDTFSIV